MNNDSFGISLFCIIPSGASPYENKMCPFFSESPCTISTKQFCVTISALDKLTDEALWRLVNWSPICFADLLVIYEHRQFQKYHHHHFQKWPFRESHSLKIEPGSQRDTTKRHAIGCPTFEKLQHSQATDVSNTPQRNTRKEGSTVQDRQVVRWPINLFSVSIIENVSSIQFALEPRGGSPNISIIFRMIPNWPTQIESTQSGNANPALTSPDLCMNYYRFQLRGDIFFGDIP